MSELNKHFRDHLNELDSFCGIIRLYGLVVVAGRCPFCLANYELDKWGGSRLKEFNTSCAFEAHLAGHLSQFRGDTCPHPVCRQPQSSLENFIYHLDDGHGIAEAGKLALKFRPKPSDGGGQKSTAAYPSNNEALPPPRNMVDGVPRDTSIDKGVLPAKGSPPPAQPAVEYVGLVGSSPRLLNLMRRKAKLHQRAKRRKAEGGIR